MTIDFPQTIIIPKNMVMDMVTKYEDHGYELKSMKELKNDVNIYVLQFFFRNNETTEKKK